MKTSEILETSFLSAENFAFAAMLVPVLLAAFELVFNILNHARNGKRRNEFKNFFLAKSA
jgi:hypothetical protein